MGLTRKTKGGTLVENAKTEVQKVTTAASAVPLKITKTTEETAKKVGAQTQGILSGLFTQAKNLTEVAKHKAISLRNTLGGKSKKRKGRKTKHTKKHKYSKKSTKKR